MPSPLISAHELLELLDRGEVTVLDVRYRMGGPPGRREYDAGHVPGAAYVDLETELSDPPADPVDDRGRHPLPDPEAFGAAMRRAGVRQDRPVVVYDDWAGHAAGRAWWLLRHHGHPQVAVLDGGWSAYREAGGAVQASTPRVEEGDFTPEAGASRTVDAEGAQRAQVLVDARASERYRGQTEPVDPVAGHVPGAVNVPTTTNLGPDGRFRDKAQLRALYEAAGVPTDGSADVAVYCGSGVTATHDLLALELLGVRAALYPGSWSGWTSDPDRPVETSR